MAATAKKTDPELWENVKDEITRGDKGRRPRRVVGPQGADGRAGVQEGGGGYEGRKTADNHLRQWQEEEWGTKSGKKSKDTGERYLPKKAREALSDEEYKRSTAKKRADTRKGRQFSAQPKDVAEKTASARKDEQGPLTNGRGDQGGADGRGPPKGV
jgi:hypothetical protein